MRLNILRVTSLILCCASLIAFAACNTDSGSESETDSESISDSTSESVSSSFDTDDKEEESNLSAPEIGIVEEDGVATVTTDRGLIYKATGYSKINGEAFVFTSGLEFSFEPDTFADEFNR